MMTHVPLQPHWLVYLPAFQSDDARIVRAGITMLMAAFHGQPAGTLPCAVEAIATVTHLSVDEVKANWSTLTAGWKKLKDTLVFEPMAQMAMRLAVDYGDALRRLQDGVAVAIAAPDLFNTELLPTQGLALQEQVAGKTLAKAMDMLGQTRAKRVLPDDAQVTPEIRDIMIGAQFTGDMHQEIWQMFVDFHQSKGTRSANWTAEFRNWLKNKTFYGRLDPKSATTSEPPRTNVRHSFNFGGANKSAAANRGEAAKEQASSNLDRAQRAIAAIKGRAVNGTQGGF